MQAIGQRKIQIRLLKNDYNIKFHLYSLKVSTNVKNTMQYFEIFWQANAPSWLRACFVSIGLSMCDSLRLIIHCALCLTKE